MQANQIYLLDIYTKSQIENIDKVKLVNLAQNCGLIEK
ncbi:hypothetical protein MNB_SUP05-SYMBIONT-5-538 [hydrothermal vent metagenome]|uniref:Uncharacterized protein n=1 Tax=hydrothermal vent metagenome TaxID=652676 RepID=A0A1W1E1E3_9ZZZZ